jgi:hypothetical protein
MYDIREFIAAVRDIIVGHELGEPGAYRRWNWQKPGQNRDLHLNPYGCADAANNLYTIGCFPQDPRERHMWVSTLRGLQDPESGLFRESTHHEIHTTAHCIAALELFDASPEHLLTGLSRYRDPEAMEDFLERLDWRHNPWGESHRGAGLYAAMVLAGEASGEWQDRYFAWLSENADPETGFLRKGCVAPVGHPPSIFPHLAGTFHYLFNQAYARRPLRYPQAMINTCLDIFRSGCFPLGKNVGFAEIDWVFCVTRSLRQCGHRHHDCHTALATFTSQYVPFLLGLDPKTDDGLNDLHALFGAICCLAELQTALPGQIKTERPLKLVLDRRPFI